MRSGAGYMLMGEARQDRARPAKDFSSTSSKMVSISARTSLVVAPGQRPRLRTEGINQDLSNNLFYVTRLS